MLYKLKNVIKQRKREQGYRLLIRNLEIRRGARIAITGPSGCGKSTTLDLLGLSLQPDSGDGFDFSPASAPLADILALWKADKLDALAALRLRNMGYVLQSGELIPYLNVEENMLLTVRLAGQSLEEARNRAHAYAEELGISHLLTALPSTLSVGERQRVAIVRALTPEPEIILADEPTAALDPLHAGKVMKIFLDAVRRSGSTLVLVTHNVEWALAGGLQELPFELIEDSKGLLAVLDNSPKGARPC